MKVDILRYCEWFALIALGAWATTRPAPERFSDRLQQELTNEKLRKVESDALMMSLRSEIRARAADRWHREDERRQWNAFFDANPQLTRVDIPNQ